jgi:adenylosuccinate synthase
MPSCVVIGAQWGDEGKGKIVDLLTEQAHLVVRFQGGNNAGHTLVVDAGQGPRKTVLHLIPSGILWPDTRCVIASGVVVDVDVLFKEIDALVAAGLAVTPQRLGVSADAHVIMPYHRDLDLAREARLLGNRIGTTGRGIGPCYEDRAGRLGIRIRDLLDPVRLRASLERVLPERNAVLNWHGLPTVDIEALIDACLARGERVRPFVIDCRAELAAALDADQNVLFEGAQGALLDVAHGTYPFVTSSHTTSGGASVGAGVPPTAVSRVLGIAKAYCTRVGGGPFPTELHDAVGERIRQLGHEFGSTTGRPRRCGFFDVPGLRAAHRLNGFTALAITKLDVLSGLDRIGVCTHYDVDGARVEVADLDVAALERATPVYEYLPGWSESLDHVRAWDELPANARTLLERIEELTGVPLGMVSVGPERSQTIVRFEAFAARS